MNKCNTIPDESLGGQHSRHGCQSLSQNTDILQVRHTLPATQCFYNAVLHSPGGHRGSRPNAEAVAGILPLIEAGFSQCLSVCLECRLGEALREIELNSLFQGGQWTKNGLKVIIVQHPFRLIVVYVS